MTEFKVGLGPAIEIPAPRELVSEISTATADCKLPLEGALGPLLVLKVAVLSERLLTDAIVFNRNPGSFPTLPPILSRPVSDDIADTVEESRADESPGKCCDDRFNENDAASVRLRELTVEIDEDLRLDGSEGASENGRDEIVDTDEEAMDTFERPEGGKPEVVLADIEDMLEESDDFKVLSESFLAPCGAGAVMLESVKVDCDNSLSPRPYVASLLSTKASDLAILEPDEIESLIEDLTFRERTPVPFVATLPCPKGYSSAELTEITEPDPLLDMDCSPKPDE